MIPGRDAACTVPEPLASCSSAHASTASILPGDVVALGSTVRLTIEAA